MKTFFAATILFLLLLTVIFGNSLLVNGICNELEKQITALTIDSDSDTAERLERYWQSKRWQVGLSVKADLLFELSDCIAEIKASSSMADAVSFTLAKARALETVKRIQSTVRPSPESLF